jgi:hypothetical protein
MATTEPIERAPARRRGLRARGGPDRLTVWLGALTAFLLVLALLAHGLRTASAPALTHHRVVLIRKIYRTTVVTAVVGGRGGGTSVTQSSTASGSVPVTGAPAPVTRTS